MGSVATVLDSTGYPVSPQLGMKYNHIRTIWGMDFQAAKYFSDTPESHHNSSSTLMPTFLQTYEKLEEKHKKKNEES